MERRALSLSAPVGSSGCENVSMKWHTRTASWIVAIALALTGLPGAVVLAQPPAKIAVRDQSFVANLHLPTCPSKCPVVLLVGGSSGGLKWSDYMGAILARHGFAALALAYFGMDGLPKELDQIPLEYFQSAFAYIRSHRSLDGDQIGIAGNSKGAELALLLASRDLAVRAVVAFAPSSVVWQSEPSSVAWNRAADRQPRRSS
jgi:dienelactone hydrolase